ncbi:MAG: GWxTD domain-containing protein [Acidobacteriota bacterium]
MYLIKFIQRSLLIGSFAVIATIPAWCQTTQATPVSPEPPNKPRNARTEPDTAFKRWLNQDAVYIITPSERKAFELLKTDQERENFIDTFWRIRDPDPETEVNEYREAYYERMAYVNEHFSSGIPGWKTDRGRIYLMWGKPDSIESHPSGGSYDRPSYEGGGSTTTYPFETWFYRHMDGPGDGVEIEFVDPTGTGEYRLARSPDEKNALAAGSGLGRTTDRSGDSSGYQRQQDTPLAWIARLSRLDSPPTAKFTDLFRVSTDGPVIDNAPLSADVRVDFFKQSDERVITAFTIQADNKDLTFDTTGGVAKATMNVFGRITAVSNKRGGIFEDSVASTSTVPELTDARSRRSIYQKTVALPPGIYKIEVIVRDLVSGNRGYVSVGFTVPKYDAETLSASSLILASTLRSSTASDTGTQFVIGETKVVPNLGGVYQQGQDIGIYLQVYNTQVDQTTLRPAVDVDYVLTKDGKEVRRQAEDWKGLSDSGQRLTLAKILSSNGLVPGEYQVKVLIHDRVRDTTIESKGNFELIK